MGSNSATKERFISLLRKYADCDGDIEMDLPLEAYGMDSFKAIQFIVDLEVEFSIEFPDYVMVPEMFNSAGSLYSCLEKVLNGELNPY